MRIAGSHIIDTRSATATLVKMLIPLWLHSMTAAFVIGLRTSLAAEVFPLGATHLYHLHSTTLLNELCVAGGGCGQDVGFRVTSEVRVTALWTDGPDAKLLRVHAAGWRLHVRGQRADDFSEQPSRLADIASRPFYVLWRAGRVDKVLLPKADTDVDARALKKGITSMLQFQLSTQETHEVDVSGNCHASYSVTGPAQSIITKDKHCEAAQKRQEGMLSSGVDSTQRTVLTLAPEKSDFVKIASIEMKETHVLSLPAYNAVGAHVDVKQVLTLSSLEESKVPNIEASTMEAAEQALLQTEDLTIETLDQIDHQTVENKMDFVEQVKVHRPALTDTKMVAEAKSAVRLLSAAREATKEDIIKVLKDPKNNRIRPELLDILGFAQSTASHAAVNKVFHIDDAAQSDLNERYLWALSFSANPNPEIMEDLLKKFKNTQNIPEKVSETLISTLASMARNLRAHPNYDQKIHNDIQSIIVNYMDATGNRAAYHRALINLQAPSTIPLLLDITAGKKKGYATKEIILAWRAILLIVQGELKQKPDGTGDVVKAIRSQAIRTFLQLRTIEDSTSRTLAFDTITTLAARPDADIDQTVDVIVSYLRAGDADSEVNQYILQRLRMLLEGTTNLRLAEALDQRLKDSATLSNYHVFSPKGLSVAMTAEVYSQGGFNKTVDGGERAQDLLRGGLSTVQEIQKGFVKRGVVSVTMDRGSDEMELFGLGIFTSGLGNFMGGAEEGEGDAMAGMELAVLGTHLRPFIFFTGQGELMSHVWSGTGSERTTAFQALMLLHDHQQHVRLGTGLTMAVDVKSAASVDLSGQITISLWYRNADAKVEKSAGVFTLGAMSVDASFASARIEFSTSLEPRLELAANVDFAASDVSLCMRLSQPALEYAYNVYKIERVDGSKHKLRRRVRRRRPIPGKTYALNKKNADMCNVIFTN